MSSTSDALEAQLASHEQRARARERASHYGELIAELLENTAADAQRRYPLI
jgi:hypothetical protein